MNALSYLIDLIPSLGWQYFYYQFAIKLFLSGFLTFESSVLRSHLEALI